MLWLKTRHLNNELFLPYNMASTDIKHIYFTPITGCITHYISACIPFSGVTLKDPEGNISTPGYPQPYPSYTACRWDIIAKEDHYIQITFMDTHFKRVFRNFDQDQISVRDGLDKNDKELMRISSTVSKPVLVTSNGRIMSLQFISLNKDSKNFYRGFHATYKTLSTSKLIEPIIVILRESLGNP